MILPYSDNLPTRRPLATLLLLALTFAFSLLLLGARWTGHAALTTHGLALMGIVPDRFNPCTLLTYPLFHDGLGHLLVNAFYLWVFGVGIEEAVGRKRFLLLYFAGGAVGGLLQWLVTITLLPAEAQSVPIVGASAACAALIGLYAVRYYRAKLNFIGLPFRVHVVVVVTLYLALEIGAGLWNLLNGDASDGVAHWAHIGGFVFGLGCAYLLGLVHAGQRAYLSLDALQAMNHNVPGAAIKNWETLLVQEPDNVDARRELSRSWLLLGDHTQAEHEYLNVLHIHLRRNQPLEAAMLYAEVRELDMKADALSASERFQLGSALEELEQFALAADTLRALSMQTPVAAEAENALIKVIALYVHRLDRRDEARVLLRLFLERHPDSLRRAEAEELRRIATTTPLFAPPSPRVASVLPLAPNIPSETPVIPIEAIIATPIEASLETSATPREASINSQTEASVTAPGEVSTETQIEASMDTPREASIEASMEALSESYMEAPIQGSATFAAATEMFSKATAICPETPVGTENAPAPSAEPAPVSSQDTDRATPLPTEEA